MQLANTSSEAQNELQAIRDEASFNLKVLNNEIEASADRRLALGANKGLKRFGAFMGMFGGLANSMGNSGGGGVNRGSNREKPSSPTMSNRSTGVRGANKE
jgi:hypothetical protein